MNIDYDKVVRFLCKKDVPILNEVLKTIVNAHFIMDSVHDNKIVLLDFNSKNKYYVEFTNRVLIYRTNYDELCLCDDFGYLFEISFNDNELNISSIINTTTPDGIVAMTFKVEYDNNYKFISGRYVILKENDLDKLSKKESIKSFIDSYYKKRSVVFNDLFWDLDLLRKCMLVDSVVNKKVSVSKDSFRDIYINFLSIVIKTMNDIAKN